MLVHKKRMCVFPGTPLGLTLPFLPVFSDFSQNHFLVLVTHQLLFYSFFSPLLLYVSQPWQSIARPQIPWCGVQGNEGISFNTTRDSQILLLICSRGCLWPMRRSWWQFEGSKTYRGKKRRKKIKKGEVLVWFLSQINLSFLALVAQLYSRTLELVIVGLVFVGSKCHQYIMYI